MDNTNYIIPFKKSKLDLGNQPVTNNLGDSLLGDKCLDSEEKLKTHIICENNFGISEYINQSKGFTGIIKQRFSDFIVNEINLNGEIVHFSDTSFVSNDSANNEILQLNILTPVQLKDLEELETLRQLSKEYLIKVDGITKEERTNIHKNIRNSFSNLDSSTETRDNIQYIIVKYKENVQLRGSRIFSNKSGEYCKFVLYKENKDTQEVLNFLSKILKVKTSIFSFAGTKDRRAKTSQEITAFKIEPNRLIGLNKILRNVALGNFRICKNELKLGDLKGNHFRIVLRNVLGDEENIIKSINSLKEIGFVNYFGMQRFGTTDVPTHHVGKALLASNWLEAIDLILKPRPNDRSEMAEMRSIWEETKDATLALKKLKHFQCVERKLLEGLIKYSIKDPLTSLNCIPRNTRLMYVHAYQSYVFNRVASNRIKLYGLDVLPGDFVEEKTDNKNIKAIEKPIIVTKENLNNFKITDVILPLPGFDVEYPKYLYQSYNSILSEDNMSNFNFKHKNKEYALSGCYRKLVIQPNNFLWLQETYTDPTISLIQSDFDLYNKNVPTSKISETKEELINQAESVNLINEVIIDENEILPIPEQNEKVEYIKKALILEFSLPSSTYATMAIRELVKQDTSSSFQTSLNKL